MNLSDLIPEHKNGMFSFGNSTEIMRIFYQLYNQLENEEDRYNLFKKSIENTKDSISGPCEEVALLISKDDKKEQVISNNHLEDLKNILLSKIKEWTKSKLLFNHDNALSIMYLWKKIDEKSCLNYISSNIETKDKLLNFLKIFIYDFYSQTMGDYTEKKTRKFNYKSIKDFIDVDSIILRIREIGNNLDEAEKFCVNNFIGFYDNKITDDEF